jgi:hypothetical protein
MTTRNSWAGPQHRHSGLNTAIMMVATAFALSFLPGGLTAQDSQAGGEIEARQMVSADAPITVLVRNHNWLDMRVYAVVEGNRWRLGTAYTGRRIEIELPRHLGAAYRPVQLVAYPIGGSGAATTGELFVLPGDEVDWVLENNLSLSSVFIG